MKNKILLILSLFSVPLAVLAESSDIKNQRAMAAVSCKLVGH